jgi:hypothetical protein
VHHKNRISRIDDDDGDQPLPMISAAEVAIETRLAGQVQSSTSNHQKLLQKEPIMKPNECSASSTPTGPDARSLTHLDEAIGINVEPMSTVDVRSLGAAINYPYVFENPLGALSIACHWATVFTLTCMEIDKFLERDRRGFCWRQFCIEGDAPHWDWSLGKGYDHQVLVTDLGVNASAVIAKSAADPQDNLRNAIRAHVDAGMRRAVFFNLEAGNPGARS